jgi:hypothetical protein
MTRFTTIASIDTPARSTLGGEAQDVAAVRIGAASST